MENGITATFTPLQLFLGIAFQLWMFIIFPIIVLRKLNYLTDLLHEVVDTQQGTD